jgi:hypothetical protein
MRLCSALLIALALPAAAIAQSASFDLVVDGKISGHDTYSLSKTKQGYKLSSKLRYNVHAAEGDFSNEYKFNGNYAYLDASLTENGSSPMMTSYVPNKTRTELTIGRVQSGSQATDFFPIKPDFFLLPPFDAGAVQGLLLAAMQPSAPSVFTVYSPTAGSDRGHSAAVDAKWVKGPGVSATLDGKPFTAQTFLLATPAFHWILYSDDAHNLLQCDLPSVKTSYIHQGFKLNDPAPAPAAFAPR